MYNEIRKRYRPLEKQGVAMLEFEKNIMKIKPELSKDDVLLKQKLENFVSTVLVKAKGFWKSRSTSTGIQFFVEIDD
jgi:hypothetical protein